MDEEVEKVVELEAEPELPKLESSAVPGPSHDSPTVDMTIEFKKDYESPAIEEIELRPYVAKPGDDALAEQRWVQAEADRILKEKQAKP